VTTSASPDDTPADLLGFNPRNLTREQLAEALSPANFIRHDAETRRLRIDFAQDHIDAQHLPEASEAAAGLAADSGYRKHPLENTHAEHFTRESVR
jgi:hypothetical protein